ncbi:MAG: UDP-N-acetylmuramate dehydrogenase, partial [Pseudomonadota bacterium]
EPLARYTSWRVGGPAQHFYRPADVEDLADFLSGLPADEPLLWLGLGSNLLIRDGGFSGTVIALQGCLDRIETTPRGVWAEAGGAGPKLARVAARAGWIGAEFLAGIPGTLGGALAMNAGAFGASTWPLVAQVTTIDRRGVLRTRDPADFRVGYREVTGPMGEWFVAATLNLAPGDGEAALTRIRELLERRAASQPIGASSCGSVFRNPPGDHAGRLIETAGLKGLQLGGAEVSAKHANFIINRGTARAADIEALIDRVRIEVAHQTGVELIPEVHRVGIEAPS